MPKTNICWRHRIRWTGRLHHNKISVRGFSVQCLRKFRGDVLIVIDIKSCCVKYYICSKDLSYFLWYKTRSCWLLLSVVCISVGIIGWSILQNVIWFCCKPKQPFTLHLSPASCSVCREKKNSCYQIESHARNHIVVNNKIPKSNTLEKHPHIASKWLKLITPNLLFTKIRGTN